MAPSKTYNAVPYDYTLSGKVTMPDKIKCCRCLKIKNQHAFSGKRLKDLEAEIAKDRRFNAATKALVACGACTGGQVVELHCIGCDKTKGLESFAKAQRRNPDKAKCWKCMQEQLNTEPGASSDSGSGGSDGSYDSDDSTYGGGGSTITGTFSNLSVTNGNSSTAGGVGLNSANGSGAYGSRVSSSNGKSSGGINVAPSTTSSTVTNRTGINATTGLPNGFNSQGYGTPPHLRSRGPASVASNASSKFAKVKAAPKKVDMDAARREQERDELAEEMDNITVQNSDSDSD